MQKKNKIEEDLNSEEQKEEHLLGVKDSLIKEVRELINLGEIERIHDICLDLPAEDLAELIEKLDPDRRIKLVETLEKDIDPETFSYFDREVLNDVLEHMPPSHIASIVNELESDDAIGLIEDLDEYRHQNVIRHLDRKLRIVVEEGLTFPEESAGRMMQRELVAVPQFWTIGKTVDYLRAAASSLPENFYNIFVVDPMYHLVGVVNLSRILSTKRSEKIDTIINDDYVTIPVKMDQSEVAFLFSRKDLLSAAVIDEKDRLMGIITIDDIVDVIHEDAEKEILNFSGVNDTDIHKQAIDTANSRFIWLVINLFTAIAASMVISLFEGTIAKFATLAVLMPIVASMGGNAGTQTLAVTVRALATRDLSSANAFRVIIKECLVGIINGSLFAVIIGTVVYLWFNNLSLGLVIGAAMVMNLFLAGFSGAAIPMVMNRWGFDPAQSAVVFLTTVTDIVGFFAFLGLASWFLM